jgi:type IV secretory pathway VirB10-like protein
LGGRFFNSKLFWVVIVLLVVGVAGAMFGIKHYGASAQVKPTAERKTVVTSLPSELKGDDTYQKLSQRVKDQPPPDLSGEVARLRDELAALKAAGHQSTNGQVPTKAPTKAPEKTTKKAADPELQRLKQEALEAKRQQAQEEQEARTSAFAPIRHDKDLDQKKAGGLTPLRSRHTVFAGDKIVLIMENALNSESPNDCVAHVAHDVYDSLTGETVLIPYGSTVNCTYSSAVFGQERLVPKAHLLTLPNGDTVKLDNLTIGTASGQAGLDGEVNHHWGRIWASIPLSVLRAGAQVTTGVLGNDVGARAAGIVVQDAAQATNQAAKGSLLTNPTINVERSKIGVILLPAPLELRPYPGRPE